MEKEKEVNIITPEHMPDANLFFQSLFKINILIPFEKEKVFYLSMEKYLDQQNEQNEKNEKNIEFQFQIAHPSISAVQLEEFISSKKYVLEKRKDYTRLTVFQSMSRLNLEYYIHFEIRNQFVAVIMTHKTFSQRNAFLILNQCHEEYEKFTKNIKQLFI